MAVAVTVALVRGAAFCAFVGLPAFYVKDLGINFITTEYILHSIRSVADFKDVLGWSFWWDQPLFFFNGFESYLITVPLSIISGNTWEAIKIAEVLLLTAAGLGTYGLMRLLGRSKVWAATAALLYTVTPFVAFSPRGNLDFAIPSTLLPTVLALGVVLVRRYGSRALPAIGGLAALVGTCASLEFALFVTLPTYIVLAAYACRGRVNLAWFSWVAVGGLVAMITGAYFIVPTFFGATFSDMAPRVATLVNASFSAEFSQRLVELLALVPREALLSPVPTYNASPLLPVAVVGGTIIWTLALLGLSANRSVLRTRSGVAATFLCIVFVILACCGSFSGGDGLWKAVGHVPLLNAIRAPDRFITFVVPFVVCLAADGLAVLFSLRRERIASALVLAVAFATMFGFSANEHVLENQQDYGSVEPDLAAVNAAVMKLDHRMVSFATGNGESPSDAAAYGIATPTVSNSWELASRYLRSGYLGFGVLRRAGVHSIVTSPPWDNSDAAGLPDFNALASQVPFAHLRYKAPGGLRVRELSNADPMVDGTVVGCLNGGPGPIDRLLDAPRLRGVAIRPGRCVPQIVANPDATSSMERADFQAVTAGSRACPTCKPLLDVDETFDLQRYGIKMPWYRTSIDGDATTFAQGAAVLIHEPTVLHLRSAMKASVLLVRGAAHGYVTLAFAFSDGSRPIIRLFPGRGLRTVAIAMPKMAKNSNVDIRISVDGLDMDDLEFSWFGYALDGIAFASAQNLRQANAADERPIVTAIDPLHYTATVDTSFASDQFVMDGLSRDDMRWTGRSGHYLIDARVGRGEHVLLRAHGRPLATATPMVDLHSGERLSDVFSAIRRPQAAITATATRVTGRIPLFDAAIGERIGSIDFLSGLSSLASIKMGDEGHRGTLNPDGFTGKRGTLVQFEIAAPLGANLLVDVRGIQGPGNAVFRLQCGGHAETILISRDVQDPMVLNNARSRCAATIRWHGLLTIGRIVVKAFEAHTTLDVWIPAGRFNARFESVSGAPLRFRQIRFDGQPLRDGVIAEQRAGRHTLELTDAPRSLNWLVLSAPGANVPVKVDVEQMAAIRYRVRLHSDGSLKIAHLHDGNWIAARNGIVYTGNRCDLLDTCFEHLPAGEFRLYHRYGAPLSIGFLSTLAALVVSIAPIALQIVMRRRAALEVVSATLRRDYRKSVVSED